MNYRSEIDGLRALAVCTVLIFHFFPNTLEIGFNGFLGVDIFFVISGFLIGQIIYKNLQSGSFSFKSFYLRRVKRILPAALLVLLVTTIFSVAILTPYQLSKYFESLVASLIFLPNIYFWRDGGYFGDLDSLKPLLHFWSLGIEEQFYAFFPFLLFFLFRFVNRTILVVFVLIGVTAISLFLNFYLNHIGGKNPAFFLLPTRAWEFGFGILAGILSIEYISKKNQLVSITALIALLGSFFLPKFNSLPLGFFPVLFTSILLMLQHDESSLVSKILSNKMSMFLGKISFSLYLWHWPIVVFLGFININGTPTYQLLLGICITVILSILSFKYVEQPFRHKFNDKMVVFSCFGLFLLLLLFALFNLNVKQIGLFDSQLVSNMSAQVQTNYRCPVKNYSSFGTSRACYLKGIDSITETKTLVVGNSHAQMYSPLIIDNNGINNAFLVPLNGCLPTINVNTSTECVEQAKRNFEAINELENVSNIIIAMTWYADVYYKNDVVVGKEEFLADILSLVEAFSVKGINVYLMSPIPVPKYDIASYLSRGLKFGFFKEENIQDYISISRDQFMEDISVFDSVLNEKLGDRYIKVYDRLCDDDWCFFGDLDGMYYSDSNHIGTYGLTKFDGILKAVSD